MPSFDVVSQVDKQEVTNAVDQANRELATRFDFKGTNAKFDVEDDQITMRAPNEFQLRQMYAVLTKRLVGRQVAIQGSKLRVSGQKRDELQQVIGMLKEAKLDLPLQFENYRD